MLDTMDTVLYTGFVVGISGVGGHFLNSPQYWIIMVFFTSFVVGISCVDLNR